MKIQYGMLSWGFVVYALALLAWSLSISVELPVVPAALLGYGIVALSAFVGGKLLNAETTLGTASYAFVWVISMAVIDGILNVPYEGVELYISLGTIINYSIVFLAPFFALFPHFGHVPTSTSDMLR